MNKLILFTAVLLAVAHAAPDLLSGLTEPVAAAVAAATTTPAPVAASTTEATINSTSSDGTLEDRTKLVAKLFKDYDKKINPDNITVKFGVSLINFHIREDRDVMDSYVWLRYVWTDPRLQWNKEEYGGTEVIRFDADMVWKPDITLYNSADPVNMINCWQSNVLIYSSGEILWVPPCKMTSHCHLTLRKEPYGEQVCKLKFGSWTFDGFVLDIDFYKGNKTIDLSDMSNSSGFEVLSTTAEKTNKYYSCCKEPYPDVTFNMTIKRIPGEELIKNW
ncbi:Acetylcholine receptor subunit beta-like 1 [Orchesella cincta]|uniref:Acetylcholine receptor subunit beta-like 1 n=1 Tax=Orchesella cincta TaxID=48709 RepID=A0A1D2M8Y9_ORCCI|nr:Acetylcholine receptor subunit beta-like 1 [Orchesella cincta]